MKKILMFLCVGSFFSLTLCALNQTNFSFADSPVQNNNTQNSKDAQLSQEELKAMIAQYEQLITDLSHAIHESEKDGYYTNEKGEKIFIIKKMSKIVADVGQMLGIVTLIGGFGYATKHALPMFSEAYFMRSEREYVFLKKYYKRLLKLVRQEKNISNLQQIKAEALQIDALLKKYDYSKILQDQKAVIETAHKYDPLRRAKAGVIVGFIGLGTFLISHYIANENDSIAVQRKEFIALQQAVESLKQRLFMLQNLIEIDYQSQN